MEWLFPEAERQFSQIVESALTDGPQIVTARGKRSVVVLSAEEFDSLKTRRATFVDDLLSGPTWDDEFIEAVNARSKKPSRDIDL